MNDGRYTELMDAAQAQEQASNEQAVARVRAMAAPEIDPRFDGVHCVEEECGDEIPRGRLALGKIRCIRCQQRRER